ncbi:PucR family transcriptional regulator [Paenibacillus lentus]|uniref:Transcriptional regulator n=1 Tax=Paenibacillus lentus TaxID=1338368 RepID=A0A3Q8S9C6_9BACL|nr:helix-turn-helix domain-containing protein [Paenibacillus lentus]AZK45461.1 transcriptional regulator [Paenibacillus lentus]
MEINLLKKQLELIIKAPVHLVSMELQEWQDLTQFRNPEDSVIARSVVLEGRSLWLCGTHHHKVQVLEANTSDLADTEVKLIELLVASIDGRRSSPAVTGSKGDEYHSQQLGAWIQEQLELENYQAGIPESLKWRTKIHGTMLPFLLGWENHSAMDISFVKLNKLLRSYFGGDIALLPLKEEWYVLVGEQLLTDLRDENEEGLDTERDMLSALSQGMYELITNEWVGGGFHLSVGDPIDPEEALVSTALLLRETLALGRIFHVTEQIHLPWELRLERLIYSIPGAQRQRFLEDTGNPVRVLDDEEIMMTLDTFFQLDCNVSETAKRLYIHRNTLLYRLDKFKQETGLDVRSFHDAVIVKLGMLLYKVTNGE